MTSKDIVKGIAKSLPVVDKVYNKLTARQIIKEDIPLQ